MNTKQYWDSIANKKEFTTPFNVKIYEDAVAKDSDVGWGYGRTIHELYRSGYKNLTGIEFYEKMIEGAKHLCPFANFQVNKGSNIPFPDKSFDSVLLFAVLTCIINDKDQQALMKEIKRILKPCEIVYINDFCSILTNVMPPDMMP